MKPTDKNERPRAPLTVKLRPAIVVRLVSKSEERPARMETPATTSKKELKIPMRLTSVSISQIDYKRFGLSRFYLVAPLNQGMRRIICPLCQGVGWNIDQQWKLKCVLCDANGWANSQDCIDYFSYIEPNLAKVKEIKLRTAPTGEDEGDAESKGASNTTASEKA